MASPVDPRLAGRIAFTHPDFTVDEIARSNQPKWIIAIGAVTENGLWREGRARTPGLHPVSWAFHAE
jgi:hypothetical protein